MPRYSIEHSIILILIGAFFVPSNSALAKNNPQAAAGAEAAAAHQQQEQAQMRQAQAQEAAARQNQARAMQEQELKAQEEARKSQEQVLRAQEDQARKNQEQAIKAQQEQAANLQREQAGKAQALAAAQRQQDALRGKQEQNQLKEQEQIRQAQQQEQQRAQIQAARGQQAERAESHQPQIAAAAGAANRATFNRPVQSRPVPTEHIVPISKGMSMPVLDQNIAAPEKEHAQAVVQNLQKHLIPVAMNNAPANLTATKNQWINNYTNNYWTSINNQRFAINRQNTYVNSVVPANYPYWYNAEPGWQFSNGFVLGNTVTAGLDWLRWGWHPYYGPQPEGFVCADDYMPTAWMYVPAYGLWMQPGVYGWAPEGPPYDYTGPITVEVLEPRHVHVNDPYNGWERQRVINVVYLYNAFFYPDAERWGYTNRHGYFVWLDL